MSEQTFSLPKRQVFVKPARTGVYAEALAKHGMASINDASITLTPTIDSRFKLVKTGLSQLEQDFLEGALGLEKNKLAPFITNDFWLTYYIKLRQNTEMLNLESPTDYLKYKILISSDKCSPSFDEITPESLFYIEDIEQTSEKLSNKAELKVQAVELFNKLNSEDRTKLLKIYGLNPEGNTEAFIKGTLFDELEKNPTKFIKIASKSRERIVLEAFVFDLVNKGVLRERAGSMFDKDVNKGNVNELVERFLDPRYQDEYEAYKERLSFNK